MNIRDGRRITNSIKKKPVNRRNFYDEDKEYNPYFQDIETAESTNKSYTSDNDDSLSAYDLEYREGESETERRKRLKIARQAKKQSQKQKIKEKDSSVLELTYFRVARIIVVALVTSFFVFVGVLQYYTDAFRFPDQMEVEESTTGRYAISEWEDLFTHMGDKSITGYFDGKSYLDQEIVYANNSDLREAFFKRIISTVEYSPYQVKALNKYGNTMLDRSGKTVFIDSYMNVGEEVKLTYVDYDSLELDEKIIKSMMEEQGVKLGDAGYSDKLIDIFCEYVLNLKELPLKTDNGHIPSISFSEEESRYYVLPDEDIFLDRLLFSSESFHNLTEEFSEIAGKGSNNPEWEVWSLSAADTRGEEPVKVFTEMPKTADWLTWDRASHKNGAPEPDKYRRDYVIGDTWCGAYYLQHERTVIDANGDEVLSVVEPSLGDGTFKNPASLNTEVITKVKNTYKSAEGDNVVIDCPIGVSMIEYGVSQDALDWFDAQDERNRGHDVKSEVQYVYYKFKIRNLSSRTVIVSDNSSLCDSNVNFSERTGLIYGLNDKVTLKPGEEGVIESWSASTTLHRKYIVWGKSFSRESDVVWFRKLAGDLEDNTEYKGVSVNNSRFSGENETEIE